MPSKKKSGISLPHSISEDTGIIPEAVADGVVAEANFLLNVRIEEDIRSDIYGYLTGYAEAVYANNPDFRKNIRSKRDEGNAGRDWLYSYMRHWLAAELLKSCPENDKARFRRILEASEFSMGREVRR